MPQTVGQLIAHHRRARGLTLQQLADAVGCAKSYLSFIEHDRRAPPAEDLLQRLERALKLDKSTLLQAARWQSTPPAIRREVSQLQDDRRAAQRLAELLGRHKPSRSTALDEAYRSGELRRLIDRLAPEDRPHRPAPLSLSVEVPLINKVAAGYPRAFTDLGYPARAADEYVRGPDLADPDAFACRVVGDSMLPDYREGDIVIFSPARPIKSGMDCFARIEPDHESTFKRVYFDTGPAGAELIRLQPLNPAYSPKVYPRDQVAGLYAAVSITRSIA